MDDITALRKYHRSKDPEAFTYLVATHQNMVYSVCNRVLANEADAADATQETFLRLACKAGSLRSNVGAWLFACATGIAKDLARKEATRRHHHQEASKEVLREHRNHSGELVIRVNEALLEISSDDRDLICTRFFEGRTQTEIALTMGVSQSLVSRRIQKAVDRLRQRVNCTGCVITSAAMMAAMEAEAAAVTVPAAVNASLIKIGLSGVGISTFAKTGAIGLMTTTSKIASAAVIVFFLLVGTAAVFLRTPPHPSIIMSTDLEEEYELREGENVRLQTPPFPSKRLQLIRSHLGADSRMYRNIERWDCVFSWGDVSKGSELQWRAGTLQHSELERRSWIAEKVLGVRWYNLGNHDAIKYPAGDWIVRTDLSIEQKLTGLANILSAQSGRTVNLERMRVRKMCVVYNDALSTIDSEALPSLLITTALPPFSEHAKNQAVSHTTELQHWCCQYDVPFIDESESLRMSQAMFSIMEDAVPTKNSGQRRSKLERVLRNLEFQIGGKFELEAREIDVWTPIVQSKTK